ncbi:hypothetical protein DFH07DRAFT_953265 [Mycena maculata]|uniref:Uncharacterized protein n=1 Tax=Mycena maculata TaxID=230809 RepID=A0AAD7JWU2_9AGAR|nr:hypothetical protein DFH07DRAFT_953265 [Mycena maculata]
MTQTIPQWKGTTRTTCNRSLPGCKRGTTVLESEEEDSEEEQPLWHRRLELAALRLGRRRTTGLTTTIPPLAAAGLAQRQALDKILDSGTACTISIAAPTSYDILTIVAHVKAQTNSLQMSELHYMLTLVQLALSIDCLQRDRVAKGLPKMTQDDLTDTYSAGTKRRTFVNWLAAGRKLLLLCAAGTMYVLPLLAALNMRTKITGETSSPTDIGSLANAIRQVKHGMWLPMVRRLMIPIKFMQSHEGYLCSLRLNYDVPVGVLEEPRSELIPFHDVSRLDGILDQVETNLYKLPPRSVEWSMANTLPWTRTTDPKEVLLPKLRKVKTPLVFQKTPSPVKKKNRDAFTEEQRGYASKATVVTSIDDFIEKSSKLHGGGNVVPKTYIELNSKMLNSEALHITDSNDQFPSPYFSVYLKSTDNSWSTQSRPFMLLCPENSRTRTPAVNFFQYLSVHYVWYARFGEKGDGAPADVHPDNLCKEGKGKSNLYQRLPRESKELQQTKEEYKRIADAFTDFFDLVRVAFKLYLGIEYDQVSMFAEDTSSGSCTWSHRDGDKVMCFVIPLGEFEGGQLGLYEVGFSFDLKMGDVLAFPSCHLTHFNCPLQG